MRHGSRTHRRGGFVLVTVLMISLMLLSTAISFAVYAKQEMRRAADEEFALVSRSLASVVCAMMMNWIAADTNEYDSERELLYTQQYPFTFFFGDWDVTAKLTPLDRLLSLNELFLPDGVTMKTEMEYPWNKYWEMIRNDRLALSILDFLDGDSDARPGSREEEHYVNRKISHISELLRIDDVEEKFLYGEGEETAYPYLGRYFGILPGGRININVAPTELLSIIDPDIGPDVAASIADYRKDNDLKSEKDLVKITGFPMAAATRLSNMIAYKSNHFMIDIKTAYGSGERNFSILVRRGGAGCEILSWGE